MLKKNEELILGDNSDINNNIQQKYQFLSTKYSQLLSDLKSQYKQYINIKEAELKSSMHVLQQTIDELNKLETNNSSINHMQMMTTNKQSMKVKRNNHELLKIVFVKP